MDVTLLFSTISTAASVGLGCGACCSPIISAFLSTYVVSHANGIKRGGPVLCQFLPGKAHQCHVPVCGGGCGKPSVYQRGWVYRRIQPPSGRAAHHERNRRCIDSALADGTKEGATFLPRMPQLRCARREKRRSAHVVCGTDLWLYPVCALVADDWLRLYPSGSSGRGHRRGIQHGKHGQPGPAADDDHWSVVKEASPGDPRLYQMVSIGIIPLTYGNAICNSDLTRG